MGSTQTERDDTRPLDSSAGSTASLPSAPSPWRRRAVVVLLVVGLALVLLAGARAARNLLPDLLNPFGGGTEQVDRTGPAVLQAIEDLSEYRAATGHFEVIVDLEEDGPLPAFLQGERTIFVAAGTVDAVVDFSQMGEGAVEVSEDRRSVSVQLPSATLSDASVDPEASYVYGRQRGLLDRLQDAVSDRPAGERDLYLLAEDRLEEAAAAGSLTATAETNTRAMLESLLRSLGFTDVTVDFT